VLEVLDLRTGYGPLEVLHGISLSISDGEFVTILGSNGAGKSTLARTCAGLLKIRAGKVVFNGTSLAHVQRHNVVRLGVGYAVESKRVFTRMTVEDNLALGAYMHGGVRGKVRPRFDRIMDLFPTLKEKLKHLGSSLSGGERQMLAIAQALMGDPRLLILDEPSSGLAPRLVSQLFTVLAQLKGEGMSLLLAEQAVDQALRACDRGYVLEAGTIALEGTSLELLRNRAVQEVYIGTLGRKDSRTEIAPTKNGLAREVT
jgi:branched-chain amino acid transport system ATP-binding protein